MIEELLIFFVTIKRIGYYSIILSYKVGQLIVYGVEKSLKYLSSIASSLWTGFVIITEDFGLFLSDLSTGVRTVLNIFMNGIDHTANGILELLYSIQSGVQNTSEFVYAIFNGLIHILTRVVIFISNLMSVLKYYFVLFGQGVWFAVTIIPLSIAYLCISTTYLIGRLVEEFTNIVSFICFNFIDTFNKIYEFVTDVPVESFAGLIIAVCLSYVLIKCHIILFKFMHNIVSNLISKCQSAFTFKFKTETDNNPKNGTCVICFERSKCLLTMPCRHLCMCLECWEQLQHYQNTNETKSCPVCRKTVQYTIHVY